MNDRADRLAVLRAQQAWFLPLAAREALVLRARLTSHQRLRCPRCGTEGWFLRAFFGRRHHPDCGLTWMEPPWTWGANALRQGVGGGFGVATDPVSAAEGGCQAALGVGCLMVVVGSLSLCLLWPVQAAWWAVRSLTNRLLG